MESISDAHTTADVYMRRLRFLAAYISSLLEYRGRFGGSEGLDFGASVDIALLMGSITLH